MPITSGSQLVAPFTGSPGSALNLATNVGPNALLGSGSYPLPSSNATGPLTACPAPAGGGGHWALANPSGSGSTVLTGLWGTPTQAYAYNNTASNLGGIIPNGGLTIDGIAYPAGTYVFQFIDFTQQGLTMDIFDTWTVPTVFRGCRSRNALGAPGFINMQGFTSTLGMHYCDIGCTSAAVCEAASAAVGIDTAGFAGTVVLVRNYVSYGTTGIQPNAQGAATVIENLVEKITLAPGAHLNGICLNGGNTCCLMQRNSVVCANPDENGGTIDQTDCIALFQDFGGYPGNGTNTDGSAGYYVQGNYVAGTGFCYYCAGPGSHGQPHNLVFTDNLVSTAIFANGGANGPAAAIPAWGSNGNFQAGNLWVPGKGQDIFGQATVTLANTFAGGTASGSITAGNSGGASGNAFDSVTAAFGGTAAYDAAHTHAGSLAGHMSAPSSAVAQLNWGAALTSGTDVLQVWFRLYGYIPAFPGRQEKIFYATPAAGFGCELDVSTDGTLAFKDSNGTTQIHTTAAIRAASWFRVEGFVIGDTSAGQMQLKVFLSPDSATADETGTSGSSVNTGGPVHNVAYGIDTGEAWDLWLDGLGASTAGYLGPIPVTLKRHSSSPAAALVAAGIIQ